MFKNEYQFPDHNPYLDIEENTLISGELNNSIFSTDEVKQLYSLVWKSAKMYPPGKVNSDLLDDLYLIGVEAFIRALKDYNPESGVKRSTFMLGYARNAISNFLKKEYTQIKHRAITHQIRESHNFNESEEVVDLSAFESLGENDPRYDRIEQEEAAQEVRIALSTLSPRQRLLAKKMFWENRTQASIAKEWNVTPGLVNKEYRRMEVKLREYFTRW